MLARQSNRRNSFVFLLLYGTVHVIVLARGEGLRTRVEFWIEAEEFEGLKEASARTGAPVAEIMRRLIREWLKKRKEGS
jgi:hypothetical protein